VTTKLIDLWYTWANYYVTQIKNDPSIPDQQQLSGKTVPWRFTG
jgi:hypothetical protein